MPVKQILIVGATGRQGRGLVHELRPQSLLDQVDAANRFQVLALTRKTTTPKAKQLAREPHVTLVQGDLDKPEGIRKIFEDAKAEGGIWGVFVALAFPGLGANADAEERHGVMLADLAFEYCVTTFIYSSLERGGESWDDKFTLDRRAKVRIERHVRGLTDKGLNWTILRPGFFMENFDGSIGNITVGVLKAGLRPETTIQLVAVDDIGRVAAGVLRKPEEFKHKILVVVGDILTMSDQEEAYQNASGCSRPSIPGFIARGLLAINSHTQGLVSDIERVHELIKINPENEAKMAESRRAHPVMTSFHAWVADKYGKPSERESNWNQVSLSKLAIGKS